MLHITRRRDATSNTLQLRPGPQSYNNNKQHTTNTKCTGKGGRKDREGAGTPPRAAREFPYHTKRHCLPHYPPPPPPL